MHRILVVEDEYELNKMICDYLKEVGFEVKGLHSGEAALKEISVNTWDVMLLDVMLPERDGFSVLQEIKDKLLPAVIMITARNLESDKLRAFSLGVDDYMTKPFSLSELEARIRAIIRRIPELKKTQNVMVAGMIELDLPGYRVRCRGRNIRVTLHQFEMLKKMAIYPGRVITREQFLDIFNDSSDDANLRTIDAHIKNIRMALGPDKHLIETVRGVGYRICDRRSYDE